MNFNRKLATLALALLFPICMSGCGAVVKSIAKPVMKSVAKNAAFVVVRSGIRVGLQSGEFPAAAGSAAYVAAQGSLKAAASESMHYAEKLNSITYELLPHVSRVTMRVLIQRYNRNQERLEKLIKELNDASLSDADAERIREESERIKQEMDRINEKADELELLELG